MVVTNLVQLDDIPLIDTPECESLGFADNVDAYRQFSGPAHLSGKNVISNEMGAVSTPAYSLTIPNLLFHVKRAAAGGVTMNVFHGSPFSGNYPNTTWPGYTTFAYMFTDMWNSIQPCWQHMKDMMDYVGRNQWSLQQGAPKVDLAFYLYESSYVVLQEYPSTNLQERGYTYDYLGSQNLLSSSATVKDGILAPAGPAYKALIFASDAFAAAAQQNLITINAVQAVAKLSKAGLPIIFVGNPPNLTIPALAQKQLQLDISVQKLLSTKNVHQISSIDALPATLSSLGISPRNSLNCSGGPIYAVWRSDVATNTDYIFFYNDQHISTSCEAHLTTSTGKTPYIYDSWTGTQQPVLQYTRSKTGVSVPISLQANQTMIVSLHSKVSSGVSPCPISSIGSNVSSLTSSGKGTIYANTLGPVTITSSSGKTWSFKSTPPPPTTLSTWNISVEDWHAPEDRFEVKTATTTHNFTSHALVPWTELTPPPTPRRGAV
jgi:alpha-L-rhamnosidase